MNYSSSVQLLVHHACPSIVYRTRKEILEENIKSPTMLELQQQILSNPEVKRILALQKEDGWLGGNFHGGNTEEPESGIRYLCEKGVEGDNPVIKRALKAIEQHGQDFDDGALVRVGKVLDNYHLGGSQMIKACVFAYAGYENQAFIKDQIEEALSAFRYVTNLSRIEDIYTQYKDKLVFKNEAVKWPSIYHLRLLAFTHNWRNDENTTMLIAALNKLVEFSPIPEIKLLHKCQLVSPAHLFMNDFNMDLKQMKAKDWMIWFHRIEMIARLGIAGEITGIADQIQTLEEILNETEGIFTKNISHFYFNKWSSYLGLALENDWKVKEKRNYDLTFRSLLILKLSNKISLS